MVGQLPADAPEGKDGDGGGGEDVIYPQGGGNPRISPSETKPLLQKSIPQLPADGKVTVGIGRVVEIPAQDDGIGTPGDQGCHFARLVLPLYKGLAQFGEDGPGGDQSGILPRFYLPDARQILLCQVYRLQVKREQPEGIGAVFDKVGIDRTLPRTAFPQFRLCRMDNGIPRKQDDTGMVVLKIMVAAEIAVRQVHMLRYVDPVVLFMRIFRGEEFLQAQDIGVTVPDQVHDLFPQDRVLFTAVIEVLKVP